MSNIQKGKFKVVKLNKILAMLLASLAFVGSSSQVFAARVKRKKDNISTSQKQSDTKSFKETDIEEYNEKGSYVPEKYAYDEQVANTYLDAFNDVVYYLTLAKDLLSFKLIIVKNTSILRYVESSPIIEKSAKDLAKSILSHSNVRSVSKLFLLIKDIGSYYNKLYGEKEEKEEEYPMSYGSSSICHIL